MNLVSTSTPGVVGKDSEVEDSLFMEDARRRSEHERFTLRSAGRCEGWAQLWVCEARLCCLQGRIQTFCMTLHFCGGSVLRQRFSFCNKG